MSSASGPSNTDPVVPMLIRPDVTGPDGRTWRTRAFGLRQDCPRLSKKLAPAAVRWTLRLVRSKSGVSSSISRSLICWLSGGWEMPSRFAAAVKLRLSATATK
jgi:hypothetical protein